MACLRGTNLSCSAEGQCCEAFLFISPYHDDLPPRAAHVGGHGVPGRERHQDVRAAWTLHLEAGSHPGTFQTVRVMGVCEGRVEDAYKPTATRYPDGHIIATCSLWYSRQYPDECTVGIVGCIPSRSAPQEQTRGKGLVRSNGAGRAHLAVGEARTNEKTHRSDLGPRTGLHQMGAPGPSGSPRLLWALKLKQSNSRWPAPILEKSGM
jgi:hypothetical protein